MLSNLCELSGFGLFVAAIWWLAGRPAAFVAAAVLLVVVGMALDGTRLELRGRLAHAFGRLGSLLTPPPVPEPEDAGEDG